MKSWLKKKSLSNWCFVVMIYFIILSVLTETLLAASLVRQIKELEDTCTEYQGAVNTDMNTILLQEKLLSK